MAKVSYRLEKIAALLKRHVGQLILQTLDDPRIAQLITISEVVVSKDLAYADVYVLVLGEAPIGLETIDSLNHAAGFLRRQLSKYMQLRGTPQLRFHLDQGIMHGRQMQHLLDAIDDPIGCD